MHTPNGTVKGTLVKVNDQTYQLQIPAAKAGLVGTWLRDLSDGYTSFNLDGQKDFSASRMPGPFVVADAKRVGAEALLPLGEGEMRAWTNPGSSATGLEGCTSRPRRRSNGWNLKIPKSNSPACTRRTSPWARRWFPFAGWDMPVWYTSVVEEHLATRGAAGLFDVSHMGVYEVKGPDAASFLDSICANDCGGLQPGESLYSQFLTPDADVIDDTLVYRRASDKYLVVVNASNDDKDRTWFLSVRDGKVKIDNKKPWARTYGYEAEIRNLRDPKSGKDMRVDIALQGPKSRDILLAMGVDEVTRAQDYETENERSCAMRSSVGST